MESGRLLDPTDNYVAVIGSKIANEVYDHQIGLKRIITINGKSVRVVGILASGEDDNSIFMPIDRAVELIEDAKPEVYDSIVVKAKDVGNEPVSKLPSQLTHAWIFIPFLFL